MRPIPSPDRSAPVRANVGDSYLSKKDSEYLKGVEKEVSLLAALVAVPPASNAPFWVAPLPCSKWYVRVYGQRCPLHVGPRGGLCYVNSNGNRSYVADYQEVVHLDDDSKNALPAQERKVQAKKEAAYIARASRHLIDMALEYSRECGARALPKSVIDNAGSPDTAVALGDSLSGYRKALADETTPDNTESGLKLATWTTTSAPAAAIETDTSDGMQSRSGPLDSTITAGSDAEPSPAVAAGDGDYHVARTVVATCQVAATTVLIALSAGMAPGAFGF